MILFVSFVCFVALMVSALIDGHVHIALPPYYELQTSYIKVVAITSLVLIGGMLFTRMFKNIILGPIGWYAGYKKHKKEKAYIQALESYALALGSMKDGFKQFKENAKYLQDDPFYWLAGYMFSEEEDTSITSQLARYKHGEFFGLFNKVNNFMDEEQYENALSLLDTADNFAHKTLWFWECMFVCHLELKDFDKAELVLKPIKSHGGDYKACECELKLTKAEEGIDVLSSLADCYSLDNSSVEVVVPYVKALLKKQKKDKAENVIKESWKSNKVIEIGMLMHEVHIDLPPVERFSIINAMVEKDLKHYATRYVLAKSALDAGLFLIARENLIELAKSHPMLAFPLLAKVETLEKKDFKAANVWLDKAVNVLVEKLSYTEL